jgi:uncharacterized membrane protein YkvA (DUF1232 family)
MSPLEPTIVKEAPPAQAAAAALTLGARSRAAVKAVLLDIRCLYFIFRHPQTRWYVRAMLFLPLAYLCSPIQLIPNFIPVLGQMDDLFVIWLANKLVRRVVDPRILTECRARAATVSFSVRFSGKSFRTRHEHQQEAAGEATEVTTITAATDRTAHPPARRAGNP